MKMAELKQMDASLLEETLKETYKQLFHIKFKKATEKVESPSEMRTLRRDVARIKTLMRQRELAAGQGHSG